MMLRIRRMADTWIQAIKSLAEKQNLEKRKRKKVNENTFIPVSCLYELFQAACSRCSFRVEIENMAKRLVFVLFSRSILLFEILLQWVVALQIVLHVLSESVLEEIF